LVKLQWPKWGRKRSPPAGAVSIHDLPGFNGEKYPGGWLGPDTFVSAALSLDYHTLRERSSHIFETNLYARGLIKRLVTNEVHTGLRLEADPIAEVLGLSEDELNEWSERTEKLFGLWAGNPQVCDYEQREDMTLGEQTAMARREALVGGDVLVITRVHEETLLPTAQLVSGQNVSTPFPAPEGVTIDNGVELDARGRQVAYYVRRPTEDGLSYEWVRIAAKGANGRRSAWLMYGMDRRVGQVRGTPLLGIVLQSLNEIDRYRDSTQRKAIISSIMTMWIEKSEDKPSSLPLTGGARRTGTAPQTNTDGATDRRIRSADYVPGMVMEELQHGEKPHAFKSDGGDTVQFPEFEGALISAIAWYCETPPEILRLSFDKNYSASQASLNEFKLYLAVQRYRIAKSFTQPLYEEWLLDQVTKGTIPAPGLLEASEDLALFETAGAWMNAEWIGAVKPVTDMLKMVRAFEVMVDRGWTTNARVAGELTGTKHATNARILRKERGLLPSLEPETTAATRSKPHDLELLDDPSVA
jgi:lambda family phage portal protein